MAFGNGLNLCWDYFLKRSFLYLELEARRLGLVVVSFFVEEECSDS